MLNLFQHPCRVPSNWAKIRIWILKQVQDDEIGRRLLAPAIGSLPTGRLLNGWRLFVINCNVWQMTGSYRPASAFLEAVAADQVPLFGSDLADANFQRLIEMTRDQDRSNRDWATMLLSQQDIDTPQVRDALVIAAQDEDDVVRAEALLGLAHRDRGLALPFACTALMSDQACMAVFEAATLIADPSLVDLLRPWTQPSDDAFLDRLAREALLACEQGQSVNQI